MERQITQKAPCSWGPAALVALVAALTFSPADAQNARDVQNDKTVLGVLTCTAVEGKDERSATEPLAVSCHFQSEAGGYTEEYVGTLRRLVGKQEFKKPVVLMWTVSADPGALSPGILEQRYLSSAPVDSPTTRQLLGEKNEAIKLSPFTNNDKKNELPVTVLDLNLKRTGA